MKRLKTIFVVTLVLVFFVTFANAEEPSLKLKRLQPFTAVFQVYNYNPTGAVKTTYYIYRQEGTVIDVYSAKLIGMFTLSPSVNFSFSNTDIDPLFAIEKGVTYTYIVKAEAADNDDRVIGTVLTNPVSITVPEPNTTLKITGANGEVLANTLVEIRKGIYSEYGMTDSSGMVGGFNLPDGQYDIIIYDQEMQTITKTGLLEITQGKPKSDEIKVQNVQSTNNSSGSAGAGSDFSKEPVNKGIEATNNSANITLVIGKKEVTIDGKKSQLDAAPYIKNNRTMVPLRLIAGDVLGAEIKWDGKAKTVTINYNGKNIVLEINRQTAYVDEQKISLDVPPEIKNGRTMVPIRFIAENFGYTVTWDGTTKTITLKKS